MSVRLAKPRFGHMMPPLCFVQDHDMIYRQPNCAWCLDHTNGWEKGLTLKIIKPVKDGDELCVKSLWCCFWNAL